MAASMALLLLERPTVSVTAVLLVALGMATLSSVHAAAKMPGCGLSATAVRRLTFCTPPEDFRPKEDCSQPLREIPISKLTDANQLGLSP